MLCLPHVKLIWDILPAGIVLFHYVKITFSKMCHSDVKHHCLFFFLSSPHFTFMFAFLMPFYLCITESVASVMWGCVEQQPGIYSHQKCVSTPSLSVSLSFFLDTTVRDEHYLSCAELSLKRLSLFAVFCVSCRCIFICAVNDRTQ